MIEANRWERPIYFCITVGESNRMGLTPYFRQTGMAYQVLPIRTKGTSSETCRDALREPGKGCH